MWICSCPLAGIAGLNRAGGMVVISLVSVVCNQVEVSATGCSLTQRSATKCGVSECDLKTSTVRRPRPTRAVKPKKEMKMIVTIIPVAKKLLLCLY